MWSTAVVMETGVVLEMGVAIEKKYKPRPPGFIVTNNSHEMRLQIYLLDFIPRLSQMEVLCSLSLFSKKYKPGAYMTRCRQVLTTVV